MAKIQKIVFEEGDTDDLIPKMKELGEMCEKVKKYYPSVWAALSTQHKLYWSSDKTLSDPLFDRKLELLFLQDDELRKK